MESIKDKGETKMNEETPFSAEELLYNAASFAGRLHFDRSHDAEDAAQDAIVAMLVAEQRAEPGRPVRHFQRKSGKCAALDCYNRNKEYRANLRLCLDRERPTREGDGITMVNTIPESVGESYTERREATENDVALANLVDSLPEKQAAVIRHRFWGNLTLTETGGKIGLSAERVRQLEEAALATLRHRYEHS